MARRAIVFTAEDQLWQFAGDGASARLRGTAVGLLRAAAGRGYRTVLAARNEQVAGGRWPLDRLHETHEALRAELDEAGARLDAIYLCVCEAACECRWPGTRLLERARDEMGIEAAASLLLADGEEARQAAERFGMPAGGPEAVGA